MTISNDMPLTPSTSAPVRPVAAKVPIHQKEGTRQLVKFCIVGASSTLINVGFLNLLYQVLHLPLVPSLTIAYVLSVFNGFFWNRRWTFRQSRGNSAATQSLRFFAVNCVGWFLNNSIVVLIVAHVESSGRAFFGNQQEFGHILLAVIAGQGKHQFPLLLLNGAILVATVVVVFWNFFANRFWTFKHKPAAA